MSSIVGVRICGFVLLTGLSLSSGACERSAQSDEKKPATEPVASAKPVERGAVGDGDLRVLLAELASARACELVRGQFRPLRALDRPDVVTGALWIRGCQITNVGTKVTFVLTGSGWQWADQQQQKAGGTFAIKQYVKFGMSATLPGALDVAYDRNSHVVSLWFTPARPPDVTFTSVGGIDVDAKGAWSSVLGAMGSVLAQSPEHLAKKEAQDQGGHELQKQLTDGLSVTVNLCSGLTRFGLGREPKGAMDKPDAGETKNVPIELQQNAVMIFGPQLVGDAGFTANVDSPDGTVHVDLACRDQAEALAAAYIDGQPLPRIKTLASKDIRGKGSLRVAKASCQVQLIAQSLEPNARPFNFAWQRPPAEVAKSTGGPLISCEVAAK